MVYKDLKSLNSGFACGAQLNQPEYVCIPSERKLWRQMCSSGPGHPSLGGQNINHSYSFHLNVLSICNLPCVLYDKLTGKIEPWHKTFSESFARCTGQHWE